MNLTKDVIPLRDDFPFNSFEAIISNDKTHLNIHWHECLEISFVKSGEGVYYVNGQVFPMQKGDIILFNNLEPHAWHATSLEPMVQPVFVFNPALIWSGQENLFDYEYLKPFYGNCSNFTNKLPCGHPITEKIYGILNFILEECNEKPPAYHLMIKAKLLEIMTYLIRHFQSDEKKAELAATRKQKLLRLQDVVKYVNHHFADIIRIDDVAGLAHMNTNYFSSFFKNVMGVSFTDYLTKLRVSKAVQQMEESGETNTVIAFACGFNSMSNFYRAFKKFMGVSPAHYHKKTLNYPKTHT